MNVFLGVEGGGTETEFLVVDETGLILAAHRAGSAYYPEIGLDALQILIEEGIRTALELASMSPAEITFACVGLRAYGEDPAVTDRLNGIASGVLPAGRYRCVNDMVSGWAGALGCRDGINVVASTGSIAYGEYAGRNARAGGWGELFSDEGSAFWVACKALALFSRMSDGRADKGPLYELMRAHFRVREDLDVCAAVYGPPPMTRSQIAGLAAIATRAYRAGDVAVQGLFVAAAQELAAIVHAVRGHLAIPPQTSLPVSCSGSMFRPGSVLTPIFEDLLHSDDRPYNFTLPQTSPCAGTVLYAAKLAGLPLTPAAVGQFAGRRAAVL